jgi:hypothetical protein
MLIELGLTRLRRLLIEALGKVAGLTAEKAALREEIARLKGLKGRPLIKALAWSRRANRSRRPAEASAVAAVASRCAAL